MKHKRIRRTRPVKRKAKPTPPVKQRKFCMNALARCGYWTRQAQRVVRKWAPIIGEEACQSYFPQAWASVVGPCDVLDIHIKPTAEDHKGFIFDLLVALNTLNMTDRLVLEWCNVNHGGWGEPSALGYERMAAWFKHCGCGTIDPRALAKAASRLRLTV